MRVLPGGGSVRPGTATPTVGGADGRQSLRVTLAGVDFTDAGDDADRVFEVCDDVPLSREPASDVAIFDREGRGLRPQSAVR